jgi:small subunit ribosomal protein S9
LEKDTVLLNKMAKKLNYTYAVGKRRTSCARIRLYKGKGESTVNGKPVAAYFPGKIAEIKLAKPYGITETSDKYYFTAKIIGGGVESQRDAVILGLSRALAKVSVEKFRPLLKKAKLLTRDSRERSRRMVGTGGKARRKKQSPKR